MSVTTFYNPDLVGQLAACGITARRSGAPVGFVLDERRRPVRPQQTVTTVVAVRHNVTITASRQLSDRPAPLALPAATGPQTGLELAEECARLRRDNQRLTSEIDRLRAEVARLTTSATAPRQKEASDLDDSARRFALLELD
jgi:hypothetical protein